MTRTPIALISTLLLPAALVAWMPTAHAQSASDEDADLGESPERYAQVRFLEGDGVVHKGAVDEPLGRGVPIAEGDAVECHGRGVLQLADGSALAFGPGTRFRITALFTDRDGVPNVLVTLDDGQLRVRRGNDSEARLRIDTPSGTCVLGDWAQGSSVPDVTLNVVRDGRGDRLVALVHGGRVSLSNEAGRTTLHAGRRLTVYGLGDALDRVSDFNAYALDDFDQWADPLLAPPPSASAEYLPEALRAYAGELDDGGRWVYVDDAGSWCWTPSVDADWRPYAYGHWGAFAGGMTWIGDEPWSYLTCHHGRWGWRPHLGWYWIPGVYYSPAWVAWNCQGPWFGWAPLGWNNQPCAWNHGAWGHGPAWTVVNVSTVHQPRLFPRINVDPGVIRGFGSAPGWSRRRILVEPTEVRDPARFQRVLAQPVILRERLRDYAHTAQRGTGRVVVMPAPAGTRPAAGGFTRLEQAQEPPRPILRPSPAPAPRPADPGASRPPLQPPLDPRQRPAPRPEPRPEPAPRPEPRPVPMPRPDPRPAPMPRPEPRPEPAPRPEPRPEAPRPMPRPEPRPEAPRPMPRPEPRPEAPRPAPSADNPRPDPPRQENRPAPAPPPRDPRK